MGRNRANLNKKLKVRLANAQSDVIKLFNAIPRKARTEKNLALNQETFTVYDYETSPEQEDQLEGAIEAALVLWLLQGQSQSKPINYYSDPNVEEAYRAGTLETVRDVNKDLTQIAILGLLLSTTPKSVEQTEILFSQVYLEKLLGYQNDVFYDIKGLSSKTSAQVYERINSGMKSGKTPREIINDIKKRFKVAESGAERIVTTQINRVNNNARMEAIDYMDNNTLLNIAGKHISALIPTTRPHHAARHERSYTTAQQTRWWDEGANRINCHCSFIPIILDDKNNEILGD